MDDTTPAGTANERRPNLLLIITDQHRPDHTGFGGNPVVRTPHLDALAARGTVFERAHVANPICMPNRSTILTGRMPTVHGVRFNGVSLDWGANTFVRVLRGDGYRTGLVGKAHFQNMGHGEGMAAGVFPVAGDAFVTAWPDGWHLYEDLGRHRAGDVELPEDWYGFDHVELVVSHSDLAGGHYHQWLKRHGVDPDALQGPTHQLAAADVGWNQIYQTALPEELYPTSYVEERSVAFLERYAADREAARADEDEPFFLQVSFPDPHHPFTPPGRYYDLYDPADVVLPESFGNPHEKSMRHIRSMTKRRGVQPGGLAIAPFACTEAQYREAAAKEYGMITMIDDAVGRILDTVESSGLADDTIVVFTSDHGELFGDHGLMLKGGMHYQGCVHVPLVVARPGQAPAATTSLVGSIDLPSTFLDLTGSAPFHGMQGTSLVPLLDDPTASVRDHVLVEEDEMFDLLGTGRPLRMRTIVTADGRLTRYEGVEQGEVYDFRVDPLELENRFDDGGAGAVLRADLTESLLTAMIDHADDAPKPTHFA